MYKSSLVILMLMLSSVWALAQKTVNGKVSSNEDNLPLPGVSIAVKGTSKGTVSNSDGTYSIQANKGDILLFRFVGFMPQEVIVTESNTINIRMKPSMEVLDQVVVIGYGTVKKKDLTGAVAQISSEEFEQRNAASISEALSGTMPGVQVSSYSGAPGSGAFVAIRGISTLNDNSVLWVVDGMPLKSIDFLNPQDIASVHVLKDASAAAIYGSQGANGVIIVETKKGKSEKVQITYNQRYGVQSVANNPKLADATEYALIQNRAALNDGRSVPYEDPYVFGTGTNWWQEITQVAPVHDYYLGLNKGSNEYSLATSLSYYNQDGVIKGGGYDRLSLRLNTDFKVGKNVKVGENFTFSNQNTINGLDDYLVWDAMRIEPVTPIYLPDYEITDQNEYSIYSPTQTDIANVMGQMARNFNASRSFRTVGNVFIEANPLKVLKLKTEAGMEIENWENNWFSPDYYIEPTDKNDENSVGATFGHKYLFNWNNIATYTQSFTDHDLTVMGAVTARSDKWDAISASGRNLPNNHPDLRFIQATTSAWDAGSSNSHITYFSYLGRLTYDYKDKYLLNASIRRDASSKFPDNQKWATFPSVSLGWKLTEEEFLKNVSWLESLKLRAAWGQIGNDNIPFDAQFTTIENFYYALGANQDILLGKAPGQIGNTGLIWETVEDINIGLDSRLFKGKLLFEIDYFRRKTSDMLMLKSLLSYMGGGFNMQWANVGSMRTSGLEFQIVHKNNIGEFNYNIGLNITNSQSVMLELADGEAIWEGNDQRLGMLTYTTEGGTVGAFYGYVTNGIFQTQSEVNNYTNDQGKVIQPTARPGDFKFVDLNGDGMITADGDRKVIGNPEALFTFGLNFSANYKGFDFRALFTGSYGNQLLTPIWAYTNSGSSNYNSYAGLYEDAWSGEGTSNSQPRLASIDPNQNFRYSDYYISDGSYVRLKNLQIGYELPTKWMKKFKIEKLRVFINGENLYTLTAYKGLDPDVGPYYSNVLLRGVNWGNYPLPRTISTGLNITF